MPDFDNDGWPDLFYVTGNVYPEIESHFPRYAHKGPKVVFRNRGGTFEDVSAASGPGATTPHSSRGAAFGDFDNDGDLDVLVMNMNEPPSLLRNDYAGGEPLAAGAPRGARVEPARRSEPRCASRPPAARAAQAVLSQSSYYSHDDLRLHFGLGTATEADRIEVRWPSGRTSVVEHVRAGQLVRITEPD